MKIKMKADKKLKICKKTFNGWRDDVCSPSKTHGNIGFYANNPEKAIKSFLYYCLKELL